MQKKICVKLPRIINPDLGRFFTEDSVRDGFNWYVYSNNNPLAFKDKTGHWVESDNQFSAPVQSVLLQLTVAYKLAKTDEERADIHQQAEKVRESFSNGIGKFVDGQKNISGAAADEFSWFLGGDVDKAERDFWLLQANNLGCNIKINEDQVLVH